MLSNFKLMEVLWKKIDKKGFNIVFSDKYKVGLFIKEAKIALRVLKIKFLKKAKLMGFFQSRGLPKTLMLGESLTAYVICKTSGTLLKRVPLRFYYFFRLFFFQVSLKSRLLWKKGLRFKHTSEAVSKRLLLFSFFLL